MIQSYPMLSSGFVSPRRPAAGDIAEGIPDVSRLLGVYVHFPFCSQLCPYCDFAVDVSREIPHGVYADAALAEVQARRAWFGAGAGTDGGGPNLVSVYFGGGTPGLWQAASLGRVLTGIREAFGVEAWSGEEITVEANPGEVEASQLGALARQGVNRVSLGAQSFDDDLLRRIGRNHAAGAIGPAVAAVRAAGIENLSCDLMYGLPGQSMAAWQRSVDALVALGPEHVSAYALTVERGTKFGSLDRAGQLDRPDDEAVAAMFEWGRQALAAAGYAQYEVSSYAQPGRRAVHNALYWSGGAYLGVGASAASFRPLADGSGWRFTNPRATATYLKAVTQGAGSPAPAKVERRSVDELENEALWLGLRMVDGVDRVAHVQRYGRDPLAGPRAAAADRCVQAGWLAVTMQAVRLTPAGFLFADEVAARLWR